MDIDTFVLSLADACFSQAPSTLLNWLIASDS